MHPRSDSEMMLPQFPSPWLDADSLIGAGWEPREMQRMMLTPPRTVLEKRLDNLTAAIREKPVWWEKVYDESITKRWEAEALEQGVDSAMFHFALQQLKHQATQCSEDGIRPSSVPGVFESNRALDAALRQEILAALKPLQDVPEAGKDWHPGSDNQVLDLVHPSLFPLVYGLSRTATDPSAVAPNPPDRVRPIRPPRKLMPRLKLLPVTASGEINYEAGGASGEGLGGVAGWSGLHAQQDPKTAAAVGVENQTLIASTVAAADSWHSPWFDAWKRHMGVPAGQPAPADDAPEKDEFTSNRFQWLPADILVGEGHRVVFDSYVNNMHPERHAPLYAATARLLQRMLPLFERTLGAAARPRRRVVNVPLENQWWSPPGEDAFWDSLRETGEAAALLREWRGDGAAAHAGHAAEDEGPEEDEGLQHTAGGGDSQNASGVVMQLAGESGAETEDAAAATGSRSAGGTGTPGGAGNEAVVNYNDLEPWQWDQLEDMYRERRRWVGATLPAVFEPPPPPMDIQLTNRTLQVIVKYAEIVLTPEKPEYPGGAWHVEGMRNEAIVASCVAYLASDNISESRLHFRSMSPDPRYEQYDDEGVRLMYGLEDEEPLNEDLGSALCVPGRMLCWHNALQHRVAPFRLADETRPGRRTIAAIFLVHPNFPVTSTRDVPPQQQEWHDAASRLGNVIPEDVRERLDALRDFPVPMERAKELRQELMAERSRVVKNTAQEVYERRFSLCEH